MHIHHPGLVVQPKVPLGPGSRGTAVSVFHNTHPRLLEGIDAGAYLFRHSQSLPADAERIITHAAAGHEFAFPRSHFIQQRFSPNEIITETERNIEFAAAELCGNIGVFSVIIKKICHKMSLLKHGAAACQIIHPGACLFCPGFMAMKPLSIDAHAHSGLGAVHRLMGTFMNHETVYSAPKLQVSGGF